MFQKSYFSLSEVLDQLPNRGRLQFALAVLIGPRRPVVVPFHPRVLRGRGLLIAALSPVIIPSGANGILQKVSQLNRTLVPAAGGGRPPGQRSVEPLCGLGLVLLLRLDLDAQVLRVHLHLLRVLQTGAVFGTVVGLGGTVALGGLVWQFRAPREPAEHFPATGGESAG